METQKKKTTSRDLATKYIYLEFIAKHGEMGRGPKLIFYVKVLTHAYGKGETRPDERFA